MLRGSPKCLKWLLQLPGGLEVVNMAHHSGKSIEELGTDPAALEVLFKADAGGGGAASDAPGDKPVTNRQRTLSEVHVVSAGVREHACGCLCVGARSLSAVTCVAKAEHLQ